MHQSTRLTCSFYTNLCKRMNKHTIPTCVRLDAGCFPLMLANAMIYISTSTSDGKRAKDTFIMLLAFNINPLQESFYTDRGPAEDKICCFVFRRTQRRQLLLQQSMRRLQVWQCSVLFTGRLLHLTFIVARGGRELHANAIEAFNAKGPGPPVSASSQVYSR